MRPLVVLSVLLVRTASAGPVGCVVTFPEGASVAEVAAALGAYAEAEDGECLDAAFEALVHDADRPGPYAAGDSALFLWRGRAEAVAVAGDHTGWRPVPMRALRGGRHWLQAVALPPAARIDYKLVIDGEWVLDPANPHRQWGGAGPNSELRMPGWTPEPLTEPRLDGPHGTLGPPDTLRSDRLGAPVVVRVYTPAGAHGPLPTLYVTDGHEYADDRLGALVTVLDNTIADGLVAPLVAVFVDPRWDGENRRAEQYVQNEAFAAFVAEDLVPHVEAAYRTRTDRAGRAVLGTSLGGLFAAFLLAEHPEAFGRAVIQSPAFWVSEPNDTFAWRGPSVFGRVEALPEGSLTVFLSTGTVHDTEAEARRMHDLLGAHGHTVTYVEVPEGHSWGNWRGLLDDALVALFPGPDAP